jgi:hypothetical protein
MENVVQKYTQCTSAAQKEECNKKTRTKKDPILEERGRRVDVLYIMLLTFPTSHAERSPLKAYE